MEKMVSHELKSIAVLKQNPVALSVYLLFPSVITWMALGEFPIKNFSLETLYLRITYL